jgi:hypothetical protein
MQRIPISTGFFVYFSKDGRALSAEREEPVLSEVLFWLRTHEGDASYESVGKWLRQKSEQLEVEAGAERIRASREELNRSFDRAARTSRLHDKELSDLARAEQFRRKGISQDDD